MSVNLIARTGNRSRADNSAVEMCVVAREQRCDRAAKTRQIQHANP